MNKEKPIERSESAEINLYENASKMKKLIIKRVNVDDVRDNGVEYGE